jgi:hypothetical protein
MDARVRLIPDKSKHLKRLNQMSSRRCVILMEAKSKAGIGDLVVIKIWLRPALTTANQAHGIRSCQFDTVRIKGEATATPQARRVPPSAVIKHQLHVGPYELDLSALLARKGA